MVRLLADFLKGKLTCLSQYLVPFDTRLGNIIYCSVDAQHVSNIGVPGLN